MVISRGPSCGPVARPKFGFPTVPLTPKFVLLNALNASSRICRRRRSPSALGQSINCLTIAMLSVNTGGCRNWLLYCDDVPKAKLGGTEKAAELKYNVCGLFGSSDVRSCPVRMGPPFALHIRASVNRTPVPRAFGQFKANRLPLRY